MEKKKIVTQKLLELHIMALVIKSNAANHLQFVLITPSTAFERLKKSSLANKNELPSKSQYAENILLLSTTNPGSTVHYHKVRRTLMAKYVTT